MHLFDGGDNPQVVDVPMRSPDALQVMREAAPESTGTLCAPDVKVPPWLKNKSSEASNLDGCSFRQIQLKDVRPRRAWN